MTAPLAPAPGSTCPAGAVPSGDTPTERMLPTLLPLAPHLLDLHQRLHACALLGEGEGGGHSGGDGGVAPLDAVVRALGRAVTERGHHAAAAAAALLQSPWLCR